MVPIRDQVVSNKGWGSVAVDVGFLVDKLFDQSWRGDDNAGRWTKLQ